MRLPPHARPRRRAQALTRFGVIGLFALGAEPGAVLTARFAERAIRCSCLLLAAGIAMMFVHSAPKNEEA